MKSILKKNTLEDVTVAFRVELPELFSVTTKEYEAIHAT